MAGHVTPQDLKHWRKQLGMTQSQAASLLGYTQPHYARFESGNKTIPEPIKWACAAIFHKLEPYSAR